MSCQLVGIACTEGQFLARMIFHEFHAYLYAILYTTVTTVCITSSFTPIGLRPYVKLPFRRPRSFFLSFIPSPKTQETTRINPRDMEMDLKGTAAQESKATINIHHQ